MRQLLSKLGGIGITRYGRTLQQEEKVHAKANKKRIRQLEQKKDKALAEVLERSLRTLHSWLFEPELCANGLPNGIRSIPAIALSPEEPMASSTDVAETSQRVKGMGARLLAWYKRAKA